MVIVSGILPCRAYALVLGVLGLLGKLFLRLPGPSLIDLQEKVVFAMDFPGGSGGCYIENVSMMTGFSVRP